VRLGRDGRERLIVVDVNVDLLAEEIDLPEGIWNDLPPKRKAILGRRETVEREPGFIAVGEQETISRRHAWLIWEQECWWIAPESAEIRVNDQPFNYSHQLHKLKDGDWIELGPVVLRFRLGTPPTDAFGDGQTKPLQSHQRPIHHQRVRFSETLYQLERFQQRLQDTTTESAGQRLAVFLEGLEAILLDSFRPELLEIRAWFPEQTEDKALCRVYPSSIYTRAKKTCQVSAKADQQTTYQVSMLTGASLEEHIPPSLRNEIVNSSEPAQIGSRNFLLGVPLRDKRGRCIGTIVMQASGADDGGFDEIANIAFKATAALCNRYLIDLFDEFATSQTNKVPIPNVSMPPITMPLMPVTQKLRPPEGRFTIEPSDYRSPLTLLRDLCAKTWKERLVLAEFEIYYHVRTLCTTQADAAKALDIERRTFGNKDERFQEIFSDRLPTNFKQRLKESLKSHDPD
jgi:hypothetical protein